ncbi:17390_t:CDS:2 [Rhizophagus irregularis]|nr:17390_t:CDS:2 [Rhizophagus irregularis]
MAQNLLQNHASSSHILNNNMNFIANYLNGRVIIDNKRFLLSNQDLINICNSMTKDIWGLDKRKAEEINIAKFFGLNNRDHELIEATVYYKPRRELNDRFILVLATKNQRDLAWKFGHQKILHMDGTFGISNKKILLFTLLILDNQKRGIPIGYLLFSAAGDAQRTSSSYNNLILKELLLHYKNKLEQENGCKFTPKVAITDCDHKERHTLIEVWPNIHLILCLFHVLQNWENKLKTVLGHFKGHEIVHKLKNTIEPTTVFTQIIIDAEAFLKNKLNQETESKKILIIQDALDFIYYIRDYWCEDLAIGWCKYGRIIAANLLQVPLEQIPTTNNHLESFNSELKVHQLQKFQNNGHLLRFDFLSERYESYASFSLKERIQLENYYNQLIEFNGNTLYLWVISDTSTHFEPKIYIVQLLPNITCQLHSYYNAEIPSLLLLPQDSLHNPETTQEYEKTFHNPETPPPSS